MSISKHSTSLLDAEPYYHSELGNIRRVTAEELPGLQNLSLERLVLAPGSIREPHWHVNGNELAYCFTGQVLVSILGTGNEFSSFTVTAGEMFYVEAGSLHHVENIGDEEALLIISLRHERPQYFSLHASFGAMTDAVLGNTYDLEASSFQTLPRDRSPKYIVKREGDPMIPTTIQLVNRHKFDMEGMAAPVADSVGSAKTARSQFWPALSNMSMYFLCIAEDGMREPHWHPDTVEMGYVHKGKARMSVLDPSGSLDTYYLQPGDCYFIPAAFPHQIECVEGDEIHFVIFFDQPMPKDVGYRKAATAMSREVLAATFGVAEKELPEFPVTVKDPLIVVRKNPVD
ncbi:putative oxalate decarboxylase OxdC [Mollisia scopiformis]|uniref:Putative oxalate decarboxylase OxdC n=1 Tax=Mollisia scopiformis TaxID=149040 RepID=A0A194XR91_MOLSC|nr:putative oxalate decarboxylase OxdC [Mollisia scopiformis]KUJ22708.1 putative oxalate decarboxylase OxdC [Mollisia scopiformis]